MSSQTTMNALVVSNWPKLSRLLNVCRGRSLGSNVASIQQIPVPTPSSLELLVKVRAVALNPTDWAHIDLIAPANSLIGCDYAGVVAQIPKDNPRNFKVGDRVAGVVHGGLYPDQGSFAEYLKIDSRGTYRVPDALSDREAATFGVSAITAMQALNLNLGVPWLDESSSSSPETPSTSQPKPTILIYAGSTASGLLALQLARLGGYQPITTCSPHSFSLVTDYGAVQAFDYHSPTLLQDITTAYPSIRTAMDCIGEGSSTSFCCKVVGASGSGGKVVNLKPFQGGKSGIPGVEVKGIVAYTLTGKEFQWWAPVGPKWGIVPGDQEALVRFFDVLPGFIGKGLKAPPIEVVEWGWDGLLRGLDLLRKKKVSGKKLVVEFGD